MHTPRLTMLNEATQPQLAPLAAEVRAERGGQFLNLYKALAHHPGICRAWLSLFTQIRQNTSLPARLRELAILRVAVLNRADYEFAAHLPFARAEGVPDALLQSLREARLPRQAFDDETLAVLDYVEAMTRDVQVTDPVFDRLKSHFTETVILELTVTVAGYNMVSRVLEALQVPHEENDVAATR